jgi:tetratricopeptide (TPR) repeat protein
VRRSFGGFTALFVLLAVGCATEQSVLGHAVVLADRGRYREAEVELERRIRAHPEDAAARQLLVRVFGLEGDLGRARQAAEELAAALGPGSPLPWIELGHALELAHRYDEALELYDRAAEVAPRDPLGPKTGGLRAARWGERELARPRLEESLRRGSRDAEVWHALGLVCLGLGDLAAAEQAYRAGLMAEPGALENHVGLATLAFMQGRPERALAEYDAILAERPKHKDALLGRSLALIQMSRYDDAERALADAEARGANRAVIAKQRALIADSRRAAAGHAEHAKESAPDPARDAPTLTP